MDIAPVWLVGLILFVASVVVRVAGFGSSLVAMPLLVPLIGLQVAAPLMTLLNLSNFSLVLLQQWRNITVRDVWRLVLMASLAAPFGIYLVFIVSEAAMKLSLGAICVVYALYRLSKLPFPSLTNPNWGWLFGTIAGLTSGAFSLGGIPIVLFANTQDWEPERFRLNMFSFFWVTGVTVSISRYFSGQLTREVVYFWLTAIPVTFVGLWIGDQLAKLVERERFQQLVLWMLILLGGRLMYTAF